MRTVFNTDQDIELEEQIWATIRECIAEGEFISVEAVTAKLATDFPGASISREEIARMIEETAVKAHTPLILGGDGSPM